MNYTYEWSNAEQTILRRTDADGRVAWVPVDEDNSDYIAYLASGKEASPYVEPPPPPELTTEEKITRLLDDYGLTREEMIAALQVKAGE